MKLKTAKISSNLPEGFFVKWGGQFENFTRAKNRLALVVPIAMIIIFGMLIAAFGSARYAIGVFLVVPLALSGGIFQNRYLLERTENLLAQNNFEVFSNNNFPANDGGIALGQLYIAANKRKI